MKNNNQKREGHIPATSSMPHLFTGKFRVGFHTAFGDIDTFVFFFGTNTDTHDLFDHKPDQEAGTKYPDENG